MVVDRPLDPAHEDEDENDNDDESEAAGRIVAPAGTIGPRGQRADENQDQDNQQNGSEHGRLPGFILPVLRKLDLTRAPGFLRSRKQQAFELTLLDFPFPQRDNVFPTGMFPAQHSSSHDTSVRHEGNLLPSSAVA
jgi:hypothetical protein